MSSKRIAAALARHRVFVVAFCMPLALAASALTAILGSSSPSHTQAAVTAAYISAEPAPGFPPHHFVLYTAPTPRPTPKPKPAPPRTPAPQPAATHRIYATPSHAAQPAVAYTAPVYTGGSLQSYARSLMSSSEFACFASVVERESGWSVTATNPYSGAYGIGQALPGSKMASAGADWRTNGRTQIRWVLSYMQSRYGSPCGAWAYWQQHSYY